MTQTHCCYQKPPVFMASHSFFNKSNNEHIICLLQTLPPLGKTKLQSPICDIKETETLTATCDEAGREAEENHHIQKLQAERCKRVEGLGWCFFELQF